MCNSTLCGLHALCVNEKCVCEPGYVGNGLDHCRRMDEVSKVDLNQKEDSDRIEDLEKENLDKFEDVDKKEHHYGCSQSPCGKFSQCREINGQAVCSCLPGYHGSPPTCRPECVVSSDCLSKQACQNQKCIDSCLGSCGVNAVCRVLSHNPICDCLPGYTGNPVSHCHLIGKMFLLQFI